MSRDPKQVEPNPIARKDVAETFAEAGLSLSQNGTQIKNDSLTIAGTDDPLTLTGASQIQSATGRYGIEFQLTQSTALIETQPAGSFGDNGGPTVAYILDSSGNVIDKDSESLDGSGTNTAILNSSSLQTGTSYHLTFDREGASYDYYAQSIETAPLSNSFIEAIGGVYNSTTTAGGDWYVTDFVQAYDPGTAGDVTLTWDKPDTVFRWDALTFGATEAGETLTIDIEENDGTGWSTIATNVARGQEITAAPNSEVRFVVNFSRDASGGLPMLNSIYRRWVV